ncbi:hypothetical protein [Deinococcus ficus]|uniref:hypothetical protein n=1 Tax=Deinococcus ficus TaxID=317577 RepID=UPI0003B4A7D3|nr:hypothetical protein [Deinococcus ficus]
MNGARPTELQQAIAALNEYVKKMPHPGDGGGRIPPGLVDPPRPDLQSILKRISEALRSDPEVEFQNRLDGLAAVAQFTLSWGSTCNDDGTSAITFNFDDLKTLNQMLTALTAV